MKSWKHFPHLAGLRSWWLWGRAPSASELWEATKGAGAMVDPIQPRDWITWAFAVARVSLEISWIYPSAIPRCTKQDAPSQISGWGGQSVFYFPCCSAWPSPDYGAHEQRATALPQPKTTAASQEMPCSPTDVSCPKPCMGVLKMLLWVSRCPSVRRKAPECVAEDEGWFLSWCDGRLSADGSSPGRFQWVQALFTTGKWRWNNILLIIYFSAVGFNPGCAPWP